MDTLSVPQYAAVVCTGMVSGTLSIIGSFVVIRVAVRRLRYNNHKKKNKSNGSSNGDSSDAWAPTMQRLILAMGMADVIASIPWVVGEFLVPPLDNRPWATGNLATCTFTGATSVFGTMSASLCNTCLAAYFWRSVRKGKNRVDFTKLERRWLVTAFLWPLCLTVGCLFTDNYGILAKGGCWAGGRYPVGCDDVEVECQRGGSSVALLPTMILFTIISCMIAAFVLTSIVWRHYRRMIRRSNRHSFSREHASANDLLLREVTIQAAFFFLVYSNIFVGFSLSTVIGYIEVDNMFPLALLGYLLMPLQGFLNCIVYLRPAYKRWKDADPELSFWVVAWRCIEAEKPKSNSMPDSNSGISITSKEAQVASMEQSLEASTTRRSLRQSDWSSDGSPEGDSNAPLQSQTPCETEEKTEVVDIQNTQTTPAPDGVLQDAKNQQELAMTSTLPRETKTDDNASESGTNHQNSDTPRRSSLVRPSVNQNKPITSMLRDLPILDEDDEYAASQEIVFQQEEDPIGASTKSAGSDLTSRSGGRRNSTGSFETVMSSFRRSRRSSWTSFLARADPTLTTSVAHMSMSASRLQMAEEYGDAFENGFF